MLASLGLSLSAQESPPLFDPNSLSLIIGGNGSVITKGASGSIFGANVSLVQTGTLGLPFQVGVRQTIEHQDFEGFDDISIFSTKVFYDVIFLKITKRLDVAAGANFGAYYGNTPLLWQVAPEFGVRWWLRPTAALVGRVEYPYDLNHGRALNIITYFFGFQVSLEKTKPK